MGRLERLVKLSKIGICLGQGMDLDNDLVQDHLARGTLSRNDEKRQSNQLIWTLWARMGPHGVEMAVKEINR